MYLYYSMIAKRLLQAASHPFAWKSSFWHTINRLCGKLDLHAAVKPNQGVDAQLSNVVTTSVPLATECWLNKVSMQFTVPEPSPATKELTPEAAVSKRHNDLFGSALHPAIESCNTILHKHVRHGQNTYEAMPLL